MLLEMTVQVWYKQVKGCYLLGLVLISSDFNPAR